MLQNYLKLAIRHLLKRKLYSFINIIGLSVGMTFAMLIGSYVWDEFSVNRSLKNADNQYIICSKWKNPDMGINFATLAPFAATLKQDYPNLVANYYHFDGITVAISNGDKHFRENVLAGDATLLSMYGFPVLYGDAPTALKEPNSIVITEEKAIKYFGKKDVIGQILTLDNFVGGKQSYLVTAVLKNLPRNSITSIFDENKNDIFIPIYSLQGRGDSDNWTNPYMVSFVELKKGVKLESISKPIAQTLARNIPDNFKGNLEVYLTPLRDYYWEANNGLAKNMVFTLIGIALFILIMAVVNFVNISIGNSSSRLKEIGVRKVLGGLKTQLIRQFLAESVILSLISMLFSLLFYLLFKPLFEDVLGKEITSIFSISPCFSIVLLVFSILIGLLSGIYPALVLSKIPSVETLKGKLKSVKENLFLRRFLLVTQFSTAIVILCATMFISKQVSYFFSKDLGYNKEAMLSFSLPRDWTPQGLAKMETMRDDFAHLPQISDVSLSFEIPNGNNGNIGSIYRVGQDSTEGTSTKILTTDEKYAQTYHIKMAAGQFFHDQRGTYNPERIVLNKVAIKALGFKDFASAIGQQVRIQSSPQTFTIAGITNDFHFGSMHEEIRPLAFVHVKNATIYRFLSLRLKTNNLSTAVAAIEKKFHQLLPDAPFELTFMDDTLRKLYKSEIQLQKASKIAIVLTLFIVLLGVLGIVSMSITKRTKELGIRKTLGASTFHIVVLFVKEFWFVLAISFILAFPIAYFMLNYWLQKFAYHIDLEWTSFLSIGLFFMAIISTLVSYQAIKAALMNPVKSLKTE